MSDKHTPQAYCETSCKRTFSESGDFAAFDAACSWLSSLGYSIGSMQRGDPIGVVRGDCSIAKWRNLTAADRLVLDGIIEGDKRNGPVTVTLRDSAALSAASTQPA